MPGIPPDEPNQEERLEKLPQDYETPFRPPAPDPDDVAADPELAEHIAEDAVDDTHPQLDTNVQPEEWYDEGLAGSGEISEPHPDNAVLSYDPEQDQRKHSDESDGQS